MSIIKFKVAAKTDVGLVRTNNEDNFQISWDLSTLPMRWVNNETHQLGEKGCLLIVADGMGGANAGEVASQIAIDTIKTSFAPEKITSDVLLSKEAINGFIKNSITLADENIKKYAVSHPETQGMGTTIVVAWVYSDKLYIGWCGDSRAYVFNPVYGLIRLTKDHSYVQQLVDSGKLSEEEAFDFPDSNIITQCLSASPQKCKPEVLSKPFYLSNGDTILLCTDGVCGMIRDTEIQNILTNSDDDLSKTSDSLISAALGASGADNATLCLMKITQGLKQAVPIKGQDNNKNKKFLIGGIFVVLIILVLLSWVIFGNNPTNTNSQTKTETETIDSLRTVNPDTTNINIQPNNVTDSVQASTIDTKLQSESPNSNGNGNNLLKGLKPGNVPISEPDNELSEESSSDVEVVSRTDIIVVKIPADKSLGIFLKQFGINNSSDFKKLNPDKDFETLKPGDEVTVYKKK